MRGKALSRSDWARLFGKCLVKRASANLEIKLSMLAEFGGKVNGKKSMKYYFRCLTIELFNFIAH
jgi:hypothetical protein